MREEREQLLKLGLAIGPCAGKLITFALAVCNPRETPATFP